MEEARAPHQETRARRDVHRGRRHGGPAAASRCRRPTIWRTSTRPATRAARRVPRPRVHARRAPARRRASRRAPARPRRIVGRGAAQGALQRTDRPLDVALGGPGFIRVTDADGASRSSPATARCSIDAQNRLVTDAAATSTGVTVPPAPSDDDVDDRPRRHASRSAADASAASTSSPSAPRRPRAPTATTPSPPPPRAAPAAAAGDATRVEQGALEASNVDVADAMTEMIEAQRAFELALARHPHAGRARSSIANGVKR